MEVRDFLSVQQQSPSTWTFTVSERHITPGRFLFGGCGLASALVALEEASDRPTIWASAQYLSYAGLGDRVTISCELVVAGGHVTQARATATAHGREILTVNAALGVGTLNAPTPWVTMPAVADPLACEPRQLPGRFANSIFDYVETRLALGRHWGELDGSTGSPTSALWARVPGHLSPSAPTLAIFGDYVSGGASQPLGRPTRGRSLDNTLRVATLVPTEWVLCEIHMHALVGGFAQGTAFLWSEDGQLLATASQTIAAKLWDDVPQ